MIHLKPVRHLELAGATALILLACGVQEHPHETSMNGVVDDFGPLNGTGGMPISAGGTGVTVAGSGTFAGTPPVAGGASGGTSSTPIGGTATGGAQAAAGSAGTSAGGSPPLSGVTINLGGVEVPKEQVIAFIHVGHSNMAGRATGPAASRPYHFQETHPHAWMYHPGSSPALAIEPKTAGDTPAAGPGTALVKEAAMLAPNTYFISLGFGKASAYCSQFLPSGLYYDQLIDGPKKIKGRVTFGAIFIYLGITERHGSDADRNGFANCINQLVTAIRTDVGEPNLPFMMNDYEMGATGELAPGGAVYNAIKPQIDKVPTVVTNSALISAADLGMEDDHHFNLDGHRTWVQRAMMTMQQRGWFTWK
ncbi:MAG TPA: sialate O-acetylesterase [Polyangiaceae bacterium]|nr:sialate O-acetylesterase [Polyangiaceae bacterium]